MTFRVIIYLQYPPFRALFASMIGKGAKLVLLLSLALFVACSNSEDDGSQEPETAGPISGTVNLHRSSGLETSSNGMNIRIVGTTQSVITDGQGNFNFSSVPFGDIELEFQKANYGTFLFRLSHNTGFGAGGSRIGNFSLGEISNTQTTFSSVDDSGSDVELTVITQPAGTVTTPVYVTVFLSRTDDLTSIRNEGVIGPIQLTSGQNATEVTLTTTQITNLGFESGETIYLRVYGDSFHTNAYAGDDGQIHPNANQPGSVVRSIVVP